MSAIIHVMGRVTKDPSIQQGKNNGSEYISLDLASSQRSQNTQNGQNGYESMFYQCYFNKFLAERLIKAGVKSGTCIYGKRQIDCVLDHDSALCIMALESKSLQFEKFMNFWDFSNCPSRRRKGLDCCIHAVFFSRRLRCLNHFMIRS